MNRRIAREIKKARLRYLISSLLLLMAFVSLSFFWNASIKEELAEQATLFVRKGLISTDMRGVVESLNGVQLSSFEHVTLFQPSGERIVTLPPVFDYRKRSESYLNWILNGNIRRPVYVDSQMKDSVGTLSFAYSRFELAHWALVIWLFATLGLWWGFLSPSIKKIQVTIQSEMRLKNAELAEEIAKKIRHNIRSPLAVLNALFIDGTIGKEDFVAQGANAVRRLEEIVSEIHGQFQGEQKDNKRAAALYELRKAVKELVAEKQTISKNVPVVLKMSDDLGPVYSEVPSSEMKATLSNLIDNSIQAYRGIGEIVVQLEADSHSISLTIVDQGKGIPERILENVFDKGFTFGKFGGTGLGLFYAKKLVEDHHGNIDIQSTENHGATISILIPRKTTPSWHLDGINLAGIEHLVACDDVPGILKAWEMRTVSLRNYVTLHFHKRTEEIPELDNAKTVFLLDYDLGAGSETGLSYARRLGLGSKAILITGHFDAPEIQSACEEVGCKLLSKDEVATIKII